MVALAQKRHSNFIAWMEANGLNPNVVARRAGIPYTTVKSYADKPGASLKGETEARIAAAYGLSVEAIFGAADMPAEARDANFIGEWRDAAGLSVEQVAQALGCAPAVILQLEAGEIELTQKWMRRLAPVLKTTPGRLLISPGDAAEELVVVASAVPESQRDQALRVLKTFTGTDG